VTPLRFERDVLVDPAEAWVVSPEPASDTNSVERPVPPGDVVLVLPRHEVVLKWLRLPTADPAEVARMVPFEALSLVPWPPDAIQTAFQIYDVAGQQSEVLVAVVRPDVLEGHLSALKQIGLAPVRVTVSTLALAHLAERTGVTRIVRHAPSGTEYVRTTDGKPVFSRGEAEPVSCIASWRASLALDTRRNNPDEVDTVIAAVLEGVDEYMVALEDWDDVTLQALPLDRLVNGEHGEQRPLQRATCTAVGAALLSRYDQATLNLLPEKYVRRLARGDLWRSLRLAVLAFVWLMAAAGGLCHHYFQVAEAHATEASEAVTALESEVGDLAAKNRELMLLADERAAASLPLNIVMALYEKTPLDIAISQLRFDNRGFLILGGEAPTYPDAFAYVDALRDVPLLGEVVFDHSSTPASGEGGFVEFQVTCDTRPALARHEAAP
jgi:hypothetical protein